MGTHFILMFDAFPLLRDARCSTLGVFDAKVGRLKTDTTKGAMDGQIQEKWEQKEVSPSNSTR